MMEPIRLTMDIPPPEIRGNSRAHRFGERGTYILTKQYKETSYYKLREAMLASGFAYEQVDKIHIGYTIYYCGIPPDRINFLQGMKSFEDALAPTKPSKRIEFGHGLISDDSPDHVVGYSLDYVRIPHKPDARVEIVITEAEAE